MEVLNSKPIELSVTAGVTEFMTVKYFDLVDGIYF